MLHKLFYIFCMLLILSLALVACEPQESDKNNDQKKVDQNTIELTFTYGSEKEDWIKDVTQVFNSSNTKISNGKKITVNAIAMGSGDCIAEILNNSRQTHIVSPASEAFIKIGNSQSQAKTNKNIVGNTETLMLSPVVIAMWKPMAEAIGWGKKPIGWAEILDLARNPQGWAAYGHPEWGRFQFGHTHPEYSNSGLISLFATIYAATGKTADLAKADIDNPKTSNYLAGIEQAVVHYGTSTGFFSSKMFANGPAYLSAAVLYENNVIDSYSPQYKLPLPIVAIYPKEGTFWSDHPIGIVEREWVSQEHQEAAKAYIKFLLDRLQQEKTLKYGFHPGDPNIAVTSPIDEAHGVDSKEPKTILQVPSVEVMDSIINLWKQHKKHSNIILVFDTSGSMKEQNRMSNAKEGAKQLISILGDKDYLSILPFNTAYGWSGKDLLMEKDRQSALNTVQGFFPAGGTALYDSISAAHQYMLQNPKEGKISAIVVLTDGADTDSRYIKLQKLLEDIRFDNEKNTIRVFTIAYGADAKEDILKSIADATQAKSYKGTPENIQAVFKEISTFF
ncbi:MAG: VWA domain-containing protein [Acidobacteria bacterium]|nr:VWA domain-containing protein [Acidobacteriota bacterium]